MTVAIVTTKEMTTDYFKWENAGPTNIRRTSEMTYSGTEARLAPSRKAARRAPGVPLLVPAHTLSWCQGMFSRPSCCSYILWPTVQEVPRSPDL